MQDSAINKQLGATENGKTKIHQIWEMQQQIKKKFMNRNIGNKCIFLVGDTNVGKTTLLYYLSGMKLNLIQNKLKKIKEMSPEVIYQNAIVRDTLSTTEIPNIFSKKQKQQQVSIIDMPGMNDNRPLSLVSNIFTFQQIFHKIHHIKKIHIAFVISQQMFEAQYIKQNLREFVQHFDVELFQTAKCISLIFTKTQDDLQTVKQTFFGYLELIKDDIEEEEDHEIAKFIEILQKLDSNQEIVYCFPRVEPDQEEGQKITLQILQRNSFIQHNNSQILNKNFVKNILLSSNFKQGLFQTNFIEILSQLQATFTQSIKFINNFVKLMNKNLVNCLFQNQQVFESENEAFCANFLQLINSFIKNNQNEALISVENLVNLMSVVCGKTEDDKGIYMIDKAVSQFLNGEVLDSEQNELKFMVLVSKSLSEVFDMLTNKVKQILNGESLCQGLKNMSEFFGWVSSPWFQSLSKTQSLPKMNAKLTQMANQLNQIKQSLWSQLVNNEGYFSVFNSFSLKQINYDDEGSEQYETDNEVVTVRKRPTLNQLKQKFINPKFYESVNAIIKSPTLQIQQEDAEFQESLKQIVSELERNVVNFVKSCQQSQASPQPIFTDDMFSFMFFQMKNLRHKILLQSVLRNFISYIKFFLYLTKIQEERKRDKKKVIQIFHKFIDNICLVLQEYWLFQQEILIYLFVNNLQRAVQALAKGIDRLRIGNHFIKQELMVKVKQLISVQQAIVEQKELFTQIIIKCYDYLIAQFSQSRQRQNHYQSQLEKQLDTIAKIAASRTQSNHRDRFKLNFSVLDKKNFRVKAICEKIKTIDQRNLNCKIYPAYETLISQSISQLINSQAIQIN